MSNQKLIIYKFNELYQIFEEIRIELSFQMEEISDENLLMSKINSLDNFIIITKKKLLNIPNSIVLENFPMKISTLVEKINIKFLKLQFGNQSKIRVNQYYFDLNSREMSLKNVKMKLTEKEIDTIIFLSKSENPITIEKLEESVWQYQPDIETHTVETHIYRLRKKILQTFNDSEFIISKKNGYQIK